MFFLINCGFQDQVLKRKQEEVSVLRKNQRGRLSLKASGRVPSREFTEKMAKQKWLKVEKSINNITISKSGIVQQEVRMEHFLKKREDLGLLHFFPFPLFSFPFFSCLFVSFLFFLFLSFFFSETV